MQKDEGSREGVFFHPLSHISCERRGYGGGLELNWKKSLTEIY